MSSQVERVEEQHDVFALVIGERHLLELTVRHHRGTFERGCLGTNARLATARRHDHGTQRARER